MTPDVRRPLASLRAPVPLVALLVLAASGGARAGEPAGAPPRAARVAWVQDLDAAKAKAAAEGKDLYLLFTGSDWCHWCRRLDQEVFEKPAFAQAASSRFVFVYLDFPDGEAAKARVLDPAKNRRLVERYGIEGYPSAVLAFADGSPYATTGYRDGGPAAYARHLEELRGKGARVRAMLAPEGREDVAGLKAGLQVLAEQRLLGWPGYDAVLGDADRKDPDGRLGLRPIVVRERERRLAEADERRLTALAEGIDDAADLPYPRLHEALREAKHLRGAGLVNWCAIVGDWLLDAQKRPQEAKALYERAAKDPVCTEDPGAKEFIAERLRKAEKALTTARAGTAAGPVRR